MVMLFFRVSYFYDVLLFRHTAFDNTLTEQIWEMFSHVACTAAGTTILSKTPCARKATLAFPLFVLLKFALFGKFKG
jgi:hypothetical protein